MFKYLCGLVGNIVGVSFTVVIYKDFCLDVAQGRRNGAPNETRTHSWMFASLA